MPVTVVTLDVSLVRGTTAKFNGELTDMNGQAAIDCYFQYKITGAGSWSDTSANKEELTAVGEFSYEISGLTENESYDVRAVAEWTDGTLQNAYGDTETFNAFWVREGSAEDFERGILDGVFIQSELEVSPNVLSLFKLHNDWENETINAVPAGWEKALTDRDWKVVESGGKQYIEKPASGTNANSGLIHSTLEAEDFDARIKVAYATASTYAVAGGLLFCFNGTTGYVIHPGAYTSTYSLRNLNLSKFSGTGTPSLVTEVALPSALSADGTWYWLRVQKNGTAIKAKMWADSDTEPGSWLLDTTDASYSEGQFGLFNREEARIFRCDEFLITPYPTGGNRQKPYKITNTSSEITWSATTPTDTTLAIEAQVKGTTAITDEAVGTGDGTTKIFTLDHWPADTPTVKVNAVAETGFTLGDDRRTMTFDTAPADTHAITASYTAVDDSVNDAVEIQTLDLDSPAGGTFKLGDGTTWTADIAYDASAADIETALEGLYGAGKAEVYDKVVFDEVGTHSWTVPAGINLVDVLLVAGGGAGGGGHYGGGGGAGGIKELSNYSVTPEGSITVVVGNGGQTNAASGLDSSFDGETALGGGGGGTTADGSNGGSGGGGGRDKLGGSATDTDPPNAVYQGYDGGDSGNRACGGGGGAGEVGEDFATTGGNTGWLAGDGGDGLDFSTKYGLVVGDDGWFGGGGGGGYDHRSTYSTSDTPSQGGKGGGGAEVYESAGSVDGMTNTGGGGSGGCTTGTAQNGGKGGSGIVIIALPKFVVTFDLSVGNSGLVADFTGLT